MKFKRASGILLHPTSLPGPYGIGDLGTRAHRWIDFLSGAGCGLWQVLPIGPTGYGDSPYQCFSSFAGNPLLISPDALLREDLLHPDDLYDHPCLPDDHVDFGQVIPWKSGVLDRSFIRFQHKQSIQMKSEMEKFRIDHSSWLEDYALFMALKEAHGGVPWHIWEGPLRQRQPEALSAARKELQVAVERQIYRQFLFYRQWASLRDHAHAKNIQIIGDIPIFVAHDSADVWVNPGLFYLDDTGMPTVVAGVPPDYFAPTG
jgi:4-alpha-glucanotransferase